MLRGTFARRAVECSAGGSRAFLVICLAAAGAGLSSTGCVDERAFSIIQNQVPETGCVIPGDQSDLYRPSGVLDLRGRQGYVLFPLIRNDLPATTSIDQQPERNRIYLRRFEIDLEILGPTTQPIPSDMLSFSVPISAEMAPGQLRSSSVEIIPDALVPLLAVPDGGRSTVVATVKVVADHNGSNIESTEFIYPVELCSGCLVTMLDSCPAADSETVLPVNECGIPQDGPVACCQSQSRGFICLVGEAQ